jgi:excisionase family DNA binding protein
MMADKLMTIKEVADYLRVSRTRLYQLARAGEVPAKRVGHLWRFSKAEIDAWLSGGGGGHGQP